MRGWRKGLEANQKYRNLFNNYLDNQCRDNYSLINFSNLFCFSILYFKGWEKHIFPYRKILWFGKPDSFENKARDEIRYVHSYGVVGFSLAQTGIFCFCTKNYSRNKYNACVFSWKLNVWNKCSKQKLQYSY